MTESSQPTLPPSDAAWQIDEACTSFEKAWKAAGPQGQKRPALDQYLGTLQGPSRIALLTELIALDIAYRRRLGEQPTAAEYHTHFPEAADALSQLFRGEDATLAPDDVPPSASAATEQPTIPGYEVLGVLGRGGMGVVYKARQEKLKRLVALKLILAGEHAGAERMRRFRSEAEAVAHLQHPNIVQLYEFGEHRGQPYFTLEFVDGGSLDQRLKGTPQPPRQAAAIVITLANAMAYAHQRGVVHRDLKPANVLLTAKGMPKITDFGLAKQLNDTSGVTATGAMLGTPSYMAPEQAGGDANKVGPAADVWALGAILYELLTGRPPYRGASVMDTVLQVLADEPAAPHLLQPKVPRDLETICLKCLRKDPRQRYPSADALAQDLRRFLKGEPIGARPVSTRERVLKWARRRPAAAGLIVLTALMLFGVLTGMLWFAGYEREQRLQADKLREQSDTLRDQAETARQKALDAQRDALAKADAETKARQKTQLHLAQMALARGQALCETNDFSRGMLWLAHSLEIAPKEIFPYEQAVRLYLGYCRQTVRPLLLCVDKKSRAALSPDAQTLVAASGTKLEFLKAATGEPLPLPILEHGANVLVVAFSPDGQTLVTADTARMVYFWNAVTGEARGTKKTSEDIRCLAFFPNGKSLVVGLANPITSYGVKGLLQRWDLASKKVLRTIELHRLWNGPMSVACSPDNRTILSGSQNGPGASLWNMDTGQNEGDLPLFSRALCVAFSPDGKNFVTGTDEGKAQWWNRSPVTPAGPPLIHPGGVRAVAVSPSGQSIMTGCGDGGARLWDPQHGQLLAPPLMHPAAVRSVAFSKGAKAHLTTCADNRVRVWGATGITPLWRVLNTPHVWSVAFRANGKEFVCATGAGEEDSIRSTGNGQLVGKPLLVHNSGPTAAWSPDSKSIVTGYWGAAGADLWHLDQRLTPFKKLHKNADVHLVAFSPDGKMILTLGNDKTVRRWNAATGQPLGVPLRHDSWVTAAQFSRDGKTILTASHDKTAKLWDAAALKDPVRQVFTHKYDVSSAVLSPDGQTVLTSSGRQAFLWDVTTGKTRGQPLPHQDNLTAVVFSPDGNTAATASNDRTARLWSTATGKPLCPPLEHPGQVTMVAFNPNGEMLLTAGDFRNVRLWDALTGQPVSPPLHHPATVTAAVFNPNGKTLLVSTRAFTNNHESELCLWKVPVPVTGDIERLTLWTQVITGLKLDAHEEVRALSAEAWQQRRQRLQELGGPP